MSAPKKSNWIVRMECRVMKDLYVENCTEEEARKNPWGLCSEEREVDMRNWEVKAITPNYNERISP